MSGAVVLFSGGQDSSTCLAWAMREFGTRGVHPVSFDYGQRHAIELDSARSVARALCGREPYVIAVEALALLADTALTSTLPAAEATASERSGNVFAREHDLPSTFVPCRNLLLLSLACAYGAQRGLHELVIGVCEADAAGYPDTCYEGDRSTRHVWGYGCGACLACVERAHGWEAFAQGTLLEESGWRSSSRSAPA
jgi:7-cyano-7-deazaguanine synthase